MPTVIEIQEFASTIEVQQFTPMQPRTSLRGPMDGSASVESEASIAHYLRAGEVTRKVPDMTWKLCVGMFVIVMAAWTSGVLPGAVH
jgi:hypothetical protein